MVGVFGRGVGCVTGCFGHDFWDVDGDCAWCGIMYRLLGEGGGRWASTPGSPARLAFSTRRVLEEIGWCFFVCVFFFAVEELVGVCP